MSSSSARSILVVEDDDETRAVLCEELQAVGYSVIGVANGREALLALLDHDNKLFLVLLDMAMPVMSGWELMAIVRSYSRLRAIPVVAVTGHVVRADVFEAILHKPPHIETLLSLVDEVAAR